MQSSPRFYVSKFSFLKSGAPLEIPKPEHPTQEEKRRFIQSISTHATNAEARFGAPAAALVAMAIIESGFGFTRLALNANDLFGYPGIGRQIENTEFMDWDNDSSHVNKLLKMLAS